LQKVRNRLARHSKIWLSRHTARIESQAPSFGGFLAIPSRYDLDGFLKRRGVAFEYALEDFRREGEITKPLMAERLASKN